LYRALFVHCSSASGVVLGRGVRSRRLSAASPWRARRIVEFRRPHTRGDSRQCTGNMKRPRLRALLLFVTATVIGLVVAAWVDFGPPPIAPPRFEIVAHKGVYQHYVGPPLEGVNGCSATIASPSHRFLENTIPSIREAFRLGATVVEIDVRRTADDHLVVFHDHSLECRTNGIGRVSSRPLSYLRTLDIGHGYRITGTQEFPFRGHGVGAMPTLEEVLEAFPSGRFLIDDKDESADTTALIARVVGALPRIRQHDLHYWGREALYEQLRSSAPEVRYFGNPARVKDCARAAALRLFLGDLPPECHDQMLGLPISYLSKTPGWPNRLLHKVRAAGSQFFVAGVDTPSELEALSRLPIDGVITERIDMIGPAVPARE
jgi:glycerophosphoryl diester phosphodiesterase